MPRPKRNLDGEIVVDGQPFLWQLRREPQWCTADGWRGMAIAVRHKDGRREAILQFPMPERRTNGSPQLQRPQVSLAIVARGIGAAIARGWEPMSRGKAVVFEVDADSC